MLSSRLSAPPESVAKAQRTVLTIAAPSTEDMIGSKRSGRPNKSPAQIMAEIEDRKAQINAELKRKYRTRRSSNIRLDEFRSAKQDLLKKMSPSCSTHTIQCFVTDPNGQVDVNLLTVTCPMRRPDLILLDPSHTIDFGTVAMNQKAWKEIHLFNVGHEMTPLKMDIIHPYGPFVQCNALRPIPPEHVLTLKFRFQTSEEGSVSFQSSSAAQLKEKVF